uniref:Movement protein n=1 Tax=Syphacia muris TaxID=451379 RepID=A0A0N5AKP7_9BILA
MNFQVSSVVDKLRRGVAKTIQAASENEAYDSLPECEDLLLADKFTVKVYELTDEISPSPSDFKPVHFEVCAKGVSGGKFFDGELVAGQGILLKTARGKVAMDIRLPDNSRSYMGKILHPAGATLYKVSQYYFQIEFNRKLGAGNEWHIVRNGQPVLNFVSTPMKEIFGVLRSLVRLFICMNGEYSLDFYKMNCDSIAFVRPSIFSKKQSIELEFKEGSTTREERAAILGSSILFLIVNIYPEYGEMLERSLPHL